MIGSLDLLAKLWDLYLLPLVALLLHLTKEVLDVLLLHDFLAVREAFEILHKIRLHGVVRLNRFHLLDPIHLRERFHAILVLRTCGKLIGNNMKERFPSKILTNVRLTCFVLALSFIVMHCVLLVQQKVNFFLSVHCQTLRAPAQTLAPTGHQEQTRPRQILFQDFECFEIWTLYSGGRICGGAGAATVERYCVVQRRVWRGRLGFYTG